MYQLGVGSGGGLHGACVHQRAVWVRGLGVGRGRANVADIRQSRPNFGLGLSHFQVKFPQNLLHCSLLTRQRLIRFPEGGSRGLYSPAGCVEFGITCTPNPVPYKPHPAPYTRRTSSAAPYTWEPEPTLPNKPSHLRDDRSLEGRDLGLRDVLHSNPSSLIPER